ncbi:MAG: hypothetical protein O6758_09520 [Planctomycetota bacterium]|nr:hypothetical protein [Planctomycetota bacterium]
MRTDSQTAEKCFAENLELFASAERAPEKHNLYAGLLNLARSISDWSNRVASIESRLERIAAGSAVRNN